MRLAAAALAAALAVGRADASPPFATSGVAGSAPGRVRCLLIAPLENTSDVSEAAQGANDVLFASAGASRGRALGEEELRAVFAGSGMELPRGLPPSVALDLAELLGADGVLYGSVEGSGGGPEPSLTVTLRVALSGSRELLQTASAAAIRGQGENILSAIRRATAETGNRVLSGVGGPPLPGCFDPARLARIRQLALAAAPPPAARDRPAPTAPAPATARQAEWSWRLGARERFRVEGVTFEKRSARIARANGLEDLAGAMRASPGTRIQIEGFVDTTGKPDDDLRLSVAMAQAAAERLLSLGIPSNRLTWVGRGSEAPLLPNFTARGRALNRRIEVVALPETASRR